MVFNTADARRRPSDWPLRAEDGMRRSDGKVGSESLTSRRRANTSSLRFQTGSLMNWTTGLVSSLYTIWGVGLVSGLPIELITPINANITDIMGDPFTLGCIMLVSALLAQGGHLFKGELDFMWLLPQQVLLSSSAFSAILSSSQGHYPDGTIKPPVFILADQLPMVILALVHFAIIMRKPRS